MLTTLTETYICLLLVYTYNQTGNNNLCPHTVLTKRIKYIYWDMLLWSLPLATKWGFPCLAVYCIDNFQKQKLSLIWDIRINRVSHEMQVQTTG